MKHPLAGLALFTGSLFAAMVFGRPPALSSETVRTPVVVELFTSEGCSSCPPADTLLAQLAEERLAGNVELIALEEHVDYWNDLGWTDPFSSRDWTLRQYLYSGALGSGNPYTPEMVVDGTVEFVGSRTQKARQAILEAAGRTKIPVTLEQGNANKTRTVDFSVKVGKREGTRDAAEVRSMSKIGEAKAEGETSFARVATVPLQKEWKRENLRAVLFVQEKKSRRILGAAEIRIAQ